MAYNYHEHDKLNKEQILYLDSRDRYVGDTNKYCVNLNFPFRNVYRVDVISYSFPRIPNLSHVAISFNQDWKSSEYVNEATFIVSNMDGGIRDGVEMSFKSDLVNIYGQKYDDSQTNFEKLNVSFHDPRDMRLLGGMGESQFVLRFRMWKESKYLNPN